MEKRTMGSLMSALRKSKGMSQQQVADRLNVSNKTVSKWECDDGYPEITILPAIAELYSITVDELLRGEVNTQTETPKSTENKSSQQLKWLLTKAKKSFCNASFIAICVAAASPILSYLVGVSFLRCSYAMITAFVFATAAVIIQFISGNNYLTVLKSEQVCTDEIDTGKFYIALKNRCFITGALSFIGIIIGIAGCIEAPNSYSYDTFLPKNPFLWLFILIVLTVAYVITNTVFKKGSSNSPELAQQRKCLTKKYFIGFAVVLIAAVSVSAGIWVIDYQIFGKITHELSGEGQLLSYLRFRDMGCSAVINTNEEKLYIESIDKDYYLGNDITVGGGIVTVNPPGTDNLSDGDTYYTYVALVQGDMLVTRHCFESLEQMNKYLKKNCIDFKDIYNIPSDFYEGNEIDKVKSDGAHILIKRYKMSTASILLIFACTASAFIGIYSIIFEIRFNKRKHFT